MVDRFQCLPASYQLTYIENEIKKPALLTTSSFSTSLQSMQSIRFEELQLVRIRTLTHPFEVPNARAASNLLVCDDGWCPATKWWWIQRGPPAEFQDMDIISRYWGQTKPYPPTSHRYETSRQSDPAFSRWWPCFERDNIIRLRGNYIPRNTSHQLQVNVEDF